MKNVIIRLEELTRDFDKIRAVDQLSLEVPPGIIFGFLGPNGAGKTTTIRLLLGLLTPTNGRAEVLGYDCVTESDKIRASTGALLEHSGIYPHLSVEDNLEFYGRINRIPDAERRNRIYVLLEQMDLWERRRDLANDLSRGMKQKLALARAMLHHPALLLLDEPTSGLDVEASVAVHDELMQLTKNEGTTIFLTTHNMSEAERLCHQVGVIRKGRLIAMGHPDELRARSGGSRVEVIGRQFSQQVLEKLRHQPSVINAEIKNGHLDLHVLPDTDNAPLVSLLVNEGVMIEEVHREKASLQDVFLTLMEEES